MDKILYTMVYQIASRQYNPSKPSRYNSLLNSLRDSSFPHTYKGSLYTRESEKVEGLYYITSTQNYVCYLVNETENNAMLQGQSIPSIVLAKNNTSEQEEFQKYVIASKKIKIYVYFTKLK